MKSLFKLLTLALCLAPNLLFAGSASSQCSGTIDCYHMWTWGILMFTCGALILFIIVKFCRKSYIDSFVTEKNAPVQATSENPNPPLLRSTSRLMVVLSGFTAIFISLLMIPYWYYTYLTCNEAIDLQDLLSFLLPLGIGIIPYTVNQVSKPTKTENT